MMIRLLLLVVFLCFSALARAQSTPQKVDEKPSGGRLWNRHTIDDSHRGADGVRLGDFDDDGHLDVVTGWEESGLVKLYLNPGPNRSKTPWPATIIARAGSPEDAVPVDVDGDGRLDIVSCHEGKTRQLLVHFNREDKWETDRFKTLDGRMWMFALPIRLRSSQQAIVVGSKGNGASITLLLAPTNDRQDLTQWTPIRLRDAGWIMSLRSVDMDHDGDQDIVFTDRKGKLRRAAWLEQPDKPGSNWNEHLIAGMDQEVMFMTATSQTCFIATRAGRYLQCDRVDDAWNLQRISHPARVVYGKAIARLPSNEIVMTANTKASPNPELPGIWLHNSRQQWSPIDETSHVKFDRIELIDLDADGDLDVMTCEERQNLGIVWYENPSR